MTFDKPRLAKEGLGIFALELVGTRLDLFPEVASDTECRCWGGESTGTTVGGLE